MATNLEKRNAAVLEILTTERTYVKGLSTLHDVFLNPIRLTPKHLLLKRSFSVKNEVNNSSKRIITNEQIAAIFSNVDTLLGFHKEILTSLEERYKEWNEESKIGDTFLKVAPFLKMYLIYLNNYDNAMNTLAVCQKQVPFREFLDTVYKDPRVEGLNIIAYLLLPVQRIPRYRLLLETVIKNTPEEHPDYSDLSKALNAILEVADKLNLGLKEAESNQKMIEIQSYFTGLPETIIEPARKYLYDGDFWKISRRAVQKRWFFLFSDCLIYGKRLSATSCQFKGKIFLGSAWVRGIDDFKKAQNVFQVVDVDKTYTMFSDTKEEKELWLTKIQSAIDQLVKRFPELKENRPEVKVPRASYLFQPFTINVDRFVSTTDLNEDHGPEGTNIFSDEEDEEDEESKENEVPAEPRGRKTSWLKIEAQKIETEDKHESYDEMEIDIIIPDHVKENSQNSLPIEHCEIVITAVEENNDIQTIEQNVQETSLVEEEMVEERKGEESVVEKVVEKEEIKVEEIVEKEEEKINEEKQDEEIKVEEIVESMDQDVSAKTNEENFIQNEEEREQEILSDTQPTQIESQIDLPSENQTESQIESQIETSSEILKDNENIDEIETQIEGQIENQTQLVSSETQMEIQIEDQSEKESEKELEIKTEALETTESQNEIEIENETPNETQNEDKAESQIETQNEIQNEDTNQNESKQEESTDTIIPDSNNTSDDSTPQESKESIQPKTKPPLPEKPKVIPPSKRTSILQSQEKTSNLEKEVPIEPKVEQPLLIRTESVKIKPPLPKKPTNIPPPRQVPPPKTKDELIKLNAKFIGPRTDMLSYGPLILDAEMIKITPVAPSLHWRHVFLFPSKIVLLKPIRKTGYYEFAEEFSLLPSWIGNSLNQGQVDDKTFQIHSLEEALTLRAENRWIKQVWLSGLSKVLKENEKKFPSLFELPNKIEHDESTNDV